MRYPSFNEVADVLEKVLQKISKPGTWTQGAFARDAHGRALSDPDKIPYSGMKPACWCIQGAIMSEVRKAPGNASRNLLLGACIDAIGVKNTTAWNDRETTTQTRVLKRLSAAIKRLRQNARIIKHDA